jgi:hypothetical protein
MAPILEKSARDAAERDAAVGKNVTSLVLKAREQQKRNPTNVYDVPFAP